MDPFEIPATVDMGEVDDDADVDGSDAVAMLGFDRALSISSGVASEHLILRTRQLSQLWDCRRFFSFSLLSLLSLSFAAD
jgi:hypothetical protein